MRKTEFSLEVFPPKISDGIEHIYGCLEGLSLVNPDFISVTYSAGTAKKGLTAEVCGYINAKYGIKSVAHLTCTGATKQSVHDELESLKNHNVKTILALRGDITEDKPIRDFHYASDLIDEINETGKFDVFGACYPEGHQESKNFAQDIDVLKMKADKGEKKFISQLFLDNADFLHMVNCALRANITAEFSAGIMPVTSVMTVDRMIKLSGAKVTAEMNSLLVKYGESKEDMRKAGLNYAIKQIRNLIEEGVSGIHLYTMDNAINTAYIYEGIKDLL